MSRRRDPGAGSRCGARWRRGRSGVAEPGGSRSPRNAGSSCFAPLSRASVLALAHGTLGAKKKKKKPDRVNSAAADETIERSLSIKKEKGAGGGDLFYAGLDTICAPNHHADVVKLT